MHVLVIPSWYPTTEAPLNGIYFAEQAQCLSRRDIRVGVVYPEHQSLRRLSWEAAANKHFQLEWTSRFGVPTLRRYGWNFWWRFPPGLRMRVRAGVRLGHRYVERHGVPDVIHAQSGRWAGAAAARLSAYYDVPFVLTEHFSGFHRDAFSWWRRPIVREGFRNANKITAVSSSLKHSLTQQGLADPSDVGVYPNLAPCSVFSLPPSGRPPQPPFRYVTIARLTPQKNVSSLLQAFARQRGTGDRLELVIVGDGPERDVLKDEAKQLGIASCVTFRGRLNRKRTRAALWNAHALVLPSRYETFGVVLLEAMATGLPVVTTARGGPEDIVTTDTGLLMPGGKTDELAAGLETVRQAWSSFEPDTIRSYVRDTYGPEPFVRRTRLLYDRAQATASGRSDIRS